MCDPGAWVKPINTNKYTIHRVLGIHPKYYAPIDCFNDLPLIINQLLETNFFAAISTGVENETNSLDCINNLYKNSNITIPLYIQSRNDKKIIEYLTQDHFSTIPIIWQNANLGLDTRFSSTFSQNNKNTILNFLESHDNIFTCVNTLINSHPMHKLKQLSNETMIEKLLP